MSVARLSLPALPTSAREVRHWLTAELRSLRSDETRDAAVLVMSEVVTNSVRHGGGGTIRITLTLMRGLLRAQVRDESAELPIRHQAGEDGGWGLEVIDLLCSRWGVHEHPGEGKTVWFEMADVDLQPAS